MDDLMQEHAAMLRRNRRAVRVRLAAVLVLVVALVLNDEMIMRALFVALLVPLMRDFQRWCNKHAVHQYVDTMLGHLDERSAAKQR